MHILRCLTVLLFLARFACAQPAEQIQAKLVALDQLRARLAGDRALVSHIQLRPVATPDGQFALQPIDTRTNQPAAPAHPSADKLYDWLFAPRPAPASGRPGSLLAVRSDAPGLSR